MGKKPHDLTPHDARHAMGRHLIEKAGNIATVQRQLGHTNAAYSIQYVRVTDEELAVLEKTRALWSVE